MKEKHERATAEVVAGSKLILGNYSDRTVYKEILRLILLEKKLLIFVMSLVIKY